MTIIEGTEILFEISGETLILSGKGKIPSYSKEEYEANLSEWISNYPSENETFPDFRESPWKDKKSIIKKIIIGEGILSIGNEAFDSMVELEDVTFPASILEIGDSAFRNCTSLRTIELPCNLEYIGESAFAGCSLLEYIYIPSYVRKIEHNAFADNVQLKKIDCGMASNIWENISEVFERRGALWSQESKYEYRQCPPYVSENTTVVFAEDTGILPLKIDPDTGLLKYCQRGAIGDIEVPDFVTGIAESAFSQCKKLKKNSATWRY